MPLHSPKIGIISQARMTSTRLPGKVLLPVAGQPLLQVHMARLRESGLPIYLAITTNATDDPLAEFAAQQQHLPCTRGDEQDVLGRYYQCAVENQLDIIVRVTSDCPLLDGQLIARGVQDYVRQEDPRLYLSNVLRRTFPRGLDFEIFSRQLLDEAFQQASLPSDREHVTPYIHQNRSGQVRFQHVTRSPDRSQYRLTVDTPDDFRLLKLLIEHHQAAALTSDELIALLDQHPELVALNAHIEQKKT
ncbi:acylneuraminate cytidylyltransferase [Hymenobacter roseosalivarius DSM 11622]|uniref:Acylneuraminate cytidylyltransferase n=1 Tax=Hymenobacter roseosalivarius DSM 11622 TaxID=645990 RepID=A0A1W1W4R6_9BACT|nr:glycosyltransferase family protein [Hymenobacter roseosalivarius]SMC00450.1 acylneuraminate cytidylyltransferase [Hymenobacter roseosalivarius DSM 11622]